SLGATLNTYPRSRAAGRSREAGWFHAVCACHVLRTGTVRGTIRAPERGVHAASPCNDQTCVDCSKLSAARTLKRTEVRAPAICCGRGPPAPARPRPELACLIRRFSASITVRPQNKPRAKPA